MDQPAQHSDKVGAYFDAHAESWRRPYERIANANDRVVAERLDLAVHMLRGLASGSLVLDAGCGTGPLALRLAESGYRVVAADLSNRMLDLFRQAIEERELSSAPIELYCGDVIDPSFDEGPFDAIVALGFLQYQKNEMGALARLRELLVPGGLLVVSGPIRRRLGNLFGLWDHVRSARRWVENRRSSRQRTELDELLEISRHHYSAKRLKLLLEATGFTLLEQQRHGFVNFAIIGPWLGTRGELALHRYLSRISRVVPIDRFANDIVALAKSS